MRTRDTTWQGIVADGHFTVNVRAVIGSTTYTAISSPVIERALCAEAVSVGNCNEASMQVSIMTDDTIPKGAAVNIQVQLADNASATNWKTMGTYYIDRREKTLDGLVNLQCFDAMLKASQPYVDETDPTSRVGWPKTMSACVTEIAQRMGLSLDSRNVIKTGNAYQVAYPAGYTMKQVLGFIGACNGGNWMVTPDNTLRLVPLVSPAASGTGATVNVPVVIGSIETAHNMTISRVSIASDSEHGYTAGDDTGIELYIEDNPCASQAICNDLYNALRGLVYAPFHATKTCFDPAAELGDTVAIGTLVNSVIYAQTMTYGPDFRADISAAGEDETGSEYPYLTEIEKINANADRIKKFAEETRDNLSSQLTQTRTEILAEVAGTYATGQSVDSKLSVSEQGILSTVAQTYATQSSVSQISQKADSIQLSVQNSDQTQLLMGTKDLRGWTHSGSVTLDAATGEVSINNTTATSDVWLRCVSPAFELGENWHGRKITISFEVQSSDWTSVTSSGLAANMNLNADGTTTTRSWNYSNYVIANNKWTANAGGQTPETAPLKNVWQRVYTTITLPDNGTYKYGFIWLFVRQRGVLKIRKPKAEWGDIATIWGVSPLDPADELMAGSTVEITKDHTRISTPTFEVRNQQTSMTFTPNGLQVPSLTVRNGEEITGSVMQYYSGAATRNVTTITDLQNLVNHELQGRYLPYDVVINLTGTADYTGSVTFRSIYGHRLYIQATSASHAKIRGKVTFVDCTTRILMYYVDVSWGGSAGITSGAIDVLNCTYVAVCDAIISAAASYTGLYASYGAKVSMFRDEFSTAHYAALADASAMINFTGCKGTGTIGSSDRTGICTVNSNSTMPYPYNSSTWTYTNYAVVLGGTPTLASGGSTPPVTTHEYNVVCSDSRNVSKPSNSDYYNWANTNTIWQGAWWDSGVTTYYRGVLKFAVPAIAGTVQSVSLTMHRNSGGTTGKANFRVYALNNTYETGSGKTHGAGRNTSAVLGSGSVGQNGDVTISLNMSISGNSTVYLVVDYDESNVQTGYSESANTAIFARAATLTINTKE